MIKANSFIKLSQDLGDKFYNFCILNRDGKWIFFIVEFILIVSSNLAFMIKILVQNKQIKNENVTFYRCKIYFYIIFQLIIYIPYIILFFYLRDSTKYSESIFYFSISLTSLSPFIFSFGYGVDQDFIFSLCSSNKRKKHFTTRNTYLRNDLTASCGDLGGKSGVSYDEGDVTYLDNERTTSIREKSSVIIA